jgi:nucleoid-associated protein YgaU
VVFAACSDSSAASRASADRMVLEVGGAHASLRQALTSAGITPAAPRPIHEPTNTPETAPAPQPKAATPVDPGREVAPPPRDEVVPPPAAPDFIEVTLGERQTLIHLAKKHLGDANRFREILTLNGWSEADSRRLLPGQKVKIPRPAARPSRR